MGAVVVNGKTYNIPNGANVQINNGVIKVNGKVLKEQEEDVKPKKAIHIAVEGIVNSVTVEGDVHGNLLVSDCEKVNVKGTVMEDVDVEYGHLTVGESIMGSVDIENGDITSVDTIMGGVYLKGGIISSVGNVMGNIAKAVAGKVFKK